MKEAVASPSQFHFDAVPGFNLSVEGAMHVDTSRKARTNGAGGTQGEGHGILTKKELYARKERREWNVWDRRGVGLYE